MTGKQLRNSILQWAIQGKLVPQDPNDEPASVLLERIRAEKARLVKEKKIKRDKNQTIIYRGEDNSYYEKTLATGSGKCIDDEIPFDIPQGWEWVRLGCIFNHTSGKQQSSSNKSGGTPQRFITTSNLYWGRFVLENVKVMNFTDEEIKTCSATKGDLLVCEGGAGYGRSAIWSYDYDICLQNHVHRLRPYVNGICEYVYHFIYFLKETNQLAAVGTAMPGLSANRLKGLLLPLPPIGEQRRIVSKLLSLEDYVNHYTELDNELSNLNNVVTQDVNKSILQEAIQGRLVPQIQSEGTAEELLEEIRVEKKRLVKEGKLKKSTIANESRIFRGDNNKYYEQIGSKVIDIDGEIPFDIPETWRWSRFGIVINLLSGRDLEPDRYNDSQSGIPYMTGASNFDGNTLMVNRWTQTPITVSKIGDLLITCKGTIGTMAINDVGDIHIARQIMAISSSVNIDFIRIFLSNSLQTLTKKAKSMIPGISRKDITEMLIPIPPLKEQERIVDRFYTLMNHIG